MRFYVSWYPGDPWYPRYDDNCAMLISVASVSQGWSLRDFSPPPRYLMLDSGGYRYAIAPNERLSPKEVFDRQLRMIEDVEVETILCALDYPILDSDVTSNEKDRCIHQTLAYAYEFKRLLSQHSFPDQIRGMAVVQGYDGPSLSRCATELRGLGFPYYGLGSVAPLRHHEEIMKRVEVVMGVVGSKLHVFGVSAVKTLRVLRRRGILSIDSSRPAKAAMYNQVFYSRPFRRFAIAKSDDKVGKAMPSHRQLSKPLPCDCPACGGKANPDILSLGQREYIRKRALHNYWHLKRVLL